MKRLLLTALMGLTLIGQAQAAQQVTVADAMKFGAGLAFAAAPLAVRGLIVIADCTKTNPELELPVLKKEISFSTFLNPLNDPYNTVTQAMVDANTWSLNCPNGKARLGSLSKRTNAWSLLAGLTSVLFLGASVAKLMDWPKLISSYMSSSTSMNMGIATGSALSIALAAAGTNFGLLLGSN